VTIVLAFLQTCAGGGTTRASGRSHVAGGSRRTPDILRSPAPFVLQTALANFAVTYELNVYCATASRMLEVCADLHRRILDVFNEYGVQIMTPAYMADPTIPKVVPPDQWHTAPADGADGRNTGAIAASTRPRALGS
jgi:hypothetical protein